MGDSYYEVCIALDSLDLLDSELAKQLQDIYTSAIVDFTQEAVEIEGAKIIIRTSKDRAFVDTLLAHIEDLSANLSEIWKTQITTTRTIEIKQNRDWIAEYRKSIKPLRCGRFYIYPPWERGNSSLTQSSRELEKSSFDRPLVLSHSDFSAQPTNLAQDTRIAERVESNSDSSDSNATDSSLRGESTPFRHTERSEVSKSRESNAMQSAMTQKRINESRKFAQNQRIVGDSQVAKMDSSRYRAQNDDRVDCHDSTFAESRNDKSISNSRDSTNLPKQTIEGIAVEVAEFLPNFECETGLGVREHSKFGKSMQDAPKRELPPQDEFATINILLEPSLAFGTGHHASTFMCIEAIQALHAQDSLKNKKLLDFGCGSGILALCAEKLGAVVDLCDIDELAIVESKKNFNNNNATISHIWQGGIADRIAKKGAKDDIYDIIIANIIASVLIEQKSNIDSHLKRGGIAVLSGILDIYKDEVLARFSDFTPLAIRQSDEWICAILQKN